MDDETLCASDMAISLEGWGSLTTPVYRASTIRFDTAADFANRFKRGPDDYIYGLYGTPTHRYLEKKLTLLNKGARTVLVPSGQAACTLSMLAVLKAGDHVLIPDTVYSSVRDFAGRELAAMGIHAAFYDPCDLAALAAAIRTETRLIWVESPGSLTMEFQDIPAIVALAKPRGILVGCDNTSATALLQKPLILGVDIVAEALSKYASGHSDILMGSITTRDDELGLRIKSMVGRLGIGTSPDDVSLVMRGMETMAVRLQRSGDTALRLAQWLADQVGVARVLHPAIDGFAGQAIWRRNYKGASGNFGVMLENDDLERIYAAMDVLETFSIGASWGGTRSLMVPVAVAPQRSVTTWCGPAHVIRLSIGTESEAALRADLDAFLKIMTGKSG